MQNAIQEEALDKAFEALSHPTRRQILTQLRENQSRTVKNLLADKTDEGVPPSAGPVIAVNHVHLPKLADASIIEWDRDIGVIWRGPRFHEIESLLKLLEKHEEDLPVGWP